MILPRQKSPLASILRLRVFIRRPPFRFAEDEVCGFLRLCTISRLSLNTSMAATAKWADLIGHVPLSAILTETDGPFVRIGSRPVVPGDIGLVIAWLAERWGISCDSASGQVADNLNNLMADLHNSPRDHQGLI